jgi:hypothetical protein
MILMSNHKDDNECGMTAEMVRIGVKIRLGLELTIWINIIFF